MNSILDRSRLLAGGTHLGLSALLGMAVAVVTLLIWYPGAVGEMAGGKKLFFLILAVDVALGPLLTSIVFDKRKPRSELVRDLSVIAVLQLGALAYGLHTLYVARPIAMAFEPGRFRLVSANDVRVSELQGAREEYRALPLTGPWLLGTRSAAPGDEKFDSITVALEGYDMGQRPSFWQPYAESRSEALKAAKPVRLLLDRHASRASELLDLLAKVNLSADSARYLPVVARGDWVVLLDTQGNVAAYAPFDGW
jgi:hypothetical protein